MNDEYKPMRRLKKSDILMANINQMLQTLVKNEVDVQFCENKRLAAGHNDAEWKKFNNALVQAKQQVTDNLTILRAMEAKHKEYLAEEAKGEEESKISV